MKIENVIAWKCREIEKAVINKLVENPLIGLISFGNLVYRAIGSLSNHYMIHKKGCYQVQLLEKPEYT